MQYKYGAMNSDLAHHYTFLGVGLVIGYLAGCVFGFLIATGDRRGLPAILWLLAILIGFMAGLCFQLEWLPWAAPATYN